MATIAFIGTGNIAQAFIKGLAEAKWNLVAYDPSAEALKLAEKLGATSEKDSISAVKKADKLNEKYSDINFCIIFISLWLFFYI